MPVLISWFYCEQHRIIIQAVITGTGKYQAVDCSDVCQCAFYPKDKVEVKL